MFAKLYGSNNEQVLVKIDAGDDGPEVRFYFKPENLGVCSVAAQFTDDDEGWDKAEAYFERVDEKSAMELMRKQKENIANLM